MQLSVQVEKYTALVYVAHYANGESGAEKPWGDGHGGNGGGMADENTGQYSDQWLVKPSAPAGPGWVQVEIAYPRPDDRETLILPFSVAGKSGTC